MGSAYVSVIVVVEEVGSAGQGDSCPGWRRWRRCLDLFFVFCSGQSEEIEESWKNGALRTSTSDNVQTSNLKRCHHSKREEAVREMGALGRWEGEGGLEK